MKNDILIKIREYKIKLISIPTLILLIFIILSITFFVKKLYIFGILFLILFILSILFLTVIPLKPEFFHKNYHKEILENYNVKSVFEGNWVVNYDIGDGKLLKQYSSPGITKNNFNHINLPTPFKICYDKLCTVPCLITHRITSNIIFISIIRQKQLEKELDEFFPKIYYIDSKKKRIICDKIENKLTKETCPKDFTKQIKKLNDILVRLGLYLDDLHQENIMVDNNGKLKIIDGEIYTKDEFNTQKEIMNNIDNGQKEPSKPYKNASNIYYWVTKNKNGEDICLNN